MKINDVILETVTKIVVFIILTFGVELFLSGHNNPGGGFIGGLVLSSAFVLLYLVYDIETVQQGIPFDYKKIAAFGVLLAVGTGVAVRLFRRTVFDAGSSVISIYLCSGIRSCLRSFCLKLGWR